MRERKELNVENTEDTEGTEKTGAYTYLFIYMGKGGSIAVNGGLRWDRDGGEFEELER
jgi:hypothetical protein